MSGVGIKIKSKKYGSNPNNNPILRKIISAKAQLPDLAIGFPFSLRSQSGTKYGNGVSVIEVAAWNQYGTKSIPSRPFLTASREQMIKTTAALRQKILEQVNNDQSCPDEVFDQIGAMCASVVKNTITAWQDPPNSPATVKAKGVNNPLVDTGLMRQSVTWEVRKKK